MFAWEARDPEAGGGTGWRRTGNGTACLILRGGDPL